MKTKNLLSNKTIEQLLRKGMAYWEHFRIFEAKITEGSMLQSEAMLFLSQNPNSTMTEIAKNLKVSTPAATTLITRMMNHGLVSRDHDQNDRRLIHINLTEQGRILLKKIQTKMLDEMQAIFEGIDEEEAEQYMETQDKVIANMRRMT